MKWRAPSFWWQAHPSPLAHLLRPFSWGYTHVQKRRREKEQAPVGAPCPVISVGNLVVGGAGKTPVTLALADLLRSHGLTPVVLTRGYGGRQAGPLWVCPQSHTVSEVGDEALLLARHFPTILARRRREGVSLLSLKPGMILLLDDGHQHESLVKDCSVVVMDALQRWGNGLVLPAGPLREPLEEGLRRAQGVVWVGEGASPGEWGVPVLTARPVLDHPLAPGQGVVGFAGLGYPRKFRHALQHAGLDVKAFVPFPDHHPYTLQECHRLESLARHHQAVLVTTEKDSLRIPKSLNLPVVFVKLRLVFDAPAELYSLIRRSCGF